MTPDWSIVVPLYNEEVVFQTLIDRLQSLYEKCQGISKKVEFVLIDDGSSDSTRQLIEDVSSKFPHFVGVILSRNFGHQIAVTAGLSVVECTEAAMVIDGDLQDPPELIFDFYEKIKEGYEVVYAVRKKRKENIFKRTGYYIFYRILNMISSIPLPHDSGDFCMITRKIVDTINDMPEQSRYLRGMRSWIGFKQIGVEYHRDKRAAGSAKYDLKMLINLAYNGVFNFSEFPIKFITKLGSLGIISSLIYFFYNVVIRFTTDKVPSGFTAIIFLIILFGSIQFLFLGILGEYIYRIFNQVKNRPIFLIDKIIK